MNREMEFNKHFINYSYSVRWEIKELVHHRKNTEYNRFQVNFHPNHPALKNVMLYTKEDEFNIYMHYEIGRKVYNPSVACYTTFYVINGENRVSKKLTSQGKKQNICIDFTGKVHFGTSLEFTVFSESLQNSGKSDILKNSINSFQIIFEIKFCEIDTLKNSNEKIVDSMNEIDIDYKQDFGSLLLNRKFCDVKLITCDGKELHAHKAVLATRSPVFSSMFEHEMKEKKENIVLIEDITHSVLQGLLMYMYTGAYDRLKEMASELLLAAEKYCMTNLRKQCEEAIIDNLTVENVIQTMIFADEHNFENLKIRTKDFTIHEAPRVITTTEYRELKGSHPHLLDELFVKLVSNR